VTGRRGEASVGTAMLTATIWMLVVTTSRVAVAAAA
jgi:hypothetical protein